MYTKYEPDLPEGTLVYSVGCISGQLTVLSKTIKKDVLHKLNGVACIFNPEDGLWATKWARQVWELYPYQHPHCTLFELLHKKLEY